MAKKHHKPEEIVAKLRQVEVLVGQDQGKAVAVRANGVTEATYYRWREEYGGLKLDQVKRLKHHKPEEIVAKLRQVEVLVGQDQGKAVAVRANGVTEATYYRWREEYGGLKLDQVKRLKQLEQESNPLRRAVSDLTLEKLILKEVAAGNF